MTPTGGPAGAAEATGFTGAWATAAAVNTKGAAAGGDARAEATEEDEAGGLGSGGVGKGGEDTGGVGSGGAG